MNRDDIALHGQYIADEISPKSSNANEKTMNGTHFNEVMKNVFSKKAQHEKTKEILTKASHVTPLMT